MAVGIENVWSPNRDTSNTVRYYGKNQVRFSNYTTPKWKLLLTNPTSQTEIEKKNKRKLKNVAPNLAFFHSMWNPIQTGGKEK